MLQQTQVATVVPFFNRFIGRFPTVADLAQASEQDVLGMWEGLGYYRRARQLQAAARKIIEDFNGEFPRDSSTVQSLPGIGRYTAGAILSIAFDQREPILEANTVRVLSRLVAFSGDPHDGAGRKFLWEIAENLLPDRKVGLFNQSLMELGSLVCTPQSPKCENCPVSNLCLAREEGLQNTIPKPKARPVFTAVRHVAVATVRRHEVLLRLCQPDERWAGLWDFPRFELAETSDDPDAIAQQVRELTGVTVRPGTQLATMRHGVTRFRIRLDCFLATPVRGRVLNHSRWIAIDDLGNYPLNTTGRKIALLLTRSPGRQGPTP